MRSLNKKNKFRSKSTNKFRSKSTNNFRSKFISKSTNKLMSKSKKYIRGGGLFNLKTYFKNKFYEVFKQYSNETGLTEASVWKVIKSRHKSQSLKQRKDLEKNTSTEIIEDIHKNVKLSKEDKAKLKEELIKMFEEKGDYELAKFIKENNIIKHSFVGGLDKIGILLGVAFVYCKFFTGDICDMLDEL